MNKPKLAYIRSFGIPEIDEYNKEQLYNTIDDGIKVELFEDKNARGLQEYLEVPAERRYVNEYVFMNIIISTIENIDKIQSVNEIYSTLEHEVNLFVLLEYSGMNTSDLICSAHIYNKYLDDFISRVMQYKTGLI